MTASGPLVVGLGRSDRGDDGVGAAVARAVAALALPGVDVREALDPTDLVALWEGRTCAVVVDAVRSGRLPGTLMVLEVGAGAAPLPESAWAGSGRGSTHALGLAAAVELARVLHRLPQRVRVVGVEAAAFDHGSGLTPAVAEVVPAAVDAVITALQQARPETQQEVPGVPR